MNFEKEEENIVLDKENSEKLSFKKRLNIFLKYFGIYLFIPALGTFMHELGHYSTSILLGYDAIIYYDSCGYECGDNCNATNSFIITIGGPVATWLQCIIPFTVLALYYKKDVRNTFEEDVPPFFVFLFIFSTFCSRFIFNAVGGIFRGFQGDEGKISRTLGLFPGTLILIFAGFAFIVLSYLLYMLPKRSRFTIMVGAISGAILGYILWYYQLGPLILPR